jgi:hypothetical protein
MPLATKPPIQQPAMHDPPTHTPTTPAAQALPSPAGVYMEVELSG